MEDLYYSSPYSSSARTSKLKLLNGGNVSPLNVSTPPPNFIGRGSNHHSRLRPPKIPILDPYASSDSSSASPGSTSPWIRYLNSSSGCSDGGRKISPLVKIESFDTPPRRSPLVNIEEDVLVMDGVLVDSCNIETPKGCSAPRIRSPLSSSDAARRQASSSSSSLSSGGSEKYRSAEDSSADRLSSKGQFAHLKEELRSSRFSKNKLEAPLCKSYRSGLCAYGTKCHFLHDQIKAAVPSMEPSPASEVLPTPRRAISPNTLQKKADSGDKNTFITAFSSDDWSPVDDVIGIGTTMPSALTEKTPSREDINAQIQATLYGPSLRMRLLVFTEFCPD